MNKELTIDEILFYHTKTGNRRLRVTDEKIKAAMQEYADQEKKKEAIAFGYMLRSDEYKHDQRSTTELYKIFNQQK